VSEVIKWSKQKCVHCNKPQGDHKSKSFNCPVAQKHKSLGYLFYSKLTTFKEVE
jgi:hypothetical protein